MTSGQPASTDWRKVFRETVSKEVVALLVGTVVIIPLSWFFRLAAPEPWNALLIVTPLAAVAVVLGRRVLHQQVLKLEGSYRWFCLLYSAAFAVAAGSDLLVWERTPMTGIEDAAPRTWLGLAHLGDWRYRLASSTRNSELMIVVTREPPLNVQTSRADLADLIAQARRVGAKAVAVDLRLRDSTPLDGRICRQVEAAGNATPPMRVFFGYGFRKIDGDLVRQPLARTIIPCAPEDASQGHLIVYLDGDGTVRSLPLTLRGDESRPALSVRIADFLGFSGERPRLLQPIPSDPAYPRIRVTDLTEDGAQRLRDRVVFVGEDSPAETFRTPWGEVLGVQLHAQAAHALLTGSYFRRLAWWPSLWALLLGTYVLALAAISGRSAWRTVRMAVVVTVGWVLLAAVAAWRAVWLDVGHVVVGIGLFAGLLVLHRRGVQRSGAA